MNKKNKLIIPKEILTIGKLGTTYGIYGWIKIFSFTENSKKIFYYKPWFIKKSGYWCSIKLDAWKCYKNNFIIKIQGIDNQNSAKLLTNCNITIDSKKLPLLKENNYYYKDLINCKVINIQGYIFGIVIHIITTGSNDVMVIKSPLKNKFYMNERLIPFLYNTVIKKINIHTKIIEIDWNPHF